MDTPEERGPLNWNTIDRRLIEMIPGLRPWECDDFTIAEIAFLLDDISPAPGPGNLSEEEMVEHLQRHYSMSPMQKLERALLRGM